MTATTKTVTFAMHSELKDLSDQQRKLYVKIRDLYRSHCLEEAAKRYQIGQLVWQARHDRNTYGEHVLLKIATALAISEKTLYRWSNVAGCFAPETFRELMHKRSKHGNRLSWTHVEMLTAARDSAEIERLVEAVLENDLSSNDLYRLVCQSLPEPASKPATPQLPRSPVLGLQALSRKAADIKQQCGVFDQGVTDKLLAQEAEEVQPEVLSRETAENRGQEPMDGSYRRDTSDSTFADRSSSPPTTTRAT